MTSSFRTVAVGALGAIVVAIAALSAHAGPTTAAEGDSTPMPHTITVSGTGKVTIVPDIAHVSLGVTITQPTVKAVRAAAASAMTKVIAAVKAQGIADADVQTSGLNLYPQYSNSSPNRVTGYTMSEQIQITIRDLDKTGDVVDAAAADGATNVNGVSFDVANPAKAMDDARGAAIAAARTSAQAMAAAGNVTLGAVVSMTDASVSQPYPIPYAMASGVAKDAATPIQVGTQDVSAVVQVVFAIS